MSCFTDEQLNRISHLVREIEKLTDVEKLYLYLQLPCGRIDNSDALGTNGKHLLSAGGGKCHQGNKKVNLPNQQHTSNKEDLFAKKPDQETTQTYTWILSHLEVDPNVSLPKQEVYDEYRAFCQANHFEPLCVADFGKAMKHAFPCIKPRRLGQRGNSRYCYSGLRKKYKMQPPNLPDMIEPTFCIDNDCSQSYSQIIRDCRDNPGDCPLYNKLVFSTNPGTTNEVINLKVEHQQQPHFHHSNGSQIDQSGVVSATQEGSINPHQQHQYNMVNNLQQFNRSVILPTTTTNNSDYIPSNPIPILQPSCSNERYSYFGAMPQPGTPDDDDYLHNYQDTIPPIAQFTTAASANNNVTMNGSDTSNNQEPYIHQYQQTQLKGVNLEGNKSVSDVAEPNNQQQRANGFIMGTPQEIHNTNSSHIHFTHRNVSQMDSCASPFQSPASTPYPMAPANPYMTSTRGSEIPDYYTNNGADNQGKPSWRTSVDGRL